MIETRFASEVIDFDDLNRITGFDNCGSNLYIMNFDTAQKFCNKYDIQLAPKLLITPYSPIEVYGWSIRILADMPDDEILVINKAHPHW